MLSQLMLNPRFATATFLSLVTEMRNSCWAVKKDMVAEWVRSGRMEGRRGATWISEISQVKEKTATQVQLHSVDAVGVRF